MTTDSRSPGSTDISRTRSTRRFHQRAPAPKGCPTRDQSKRVSRTSASLPWGTHETAENGTKKRASRDEPWTPVCRSGPTPAKAIFAHSNRGTIGKFLMALRIGGAEGKSANLRQSPHDALPSSAVAAGPCFQNNRTQSKRELELASQRATYVTEQSVAYINSCIAANLTRPIIPHIMNQASVSSIVYRLLVAAVYSRNDASFFAVHCRHGRRGKRRHGRGLRC